MERFIGFNCNPLLGNGLYMADVEAHFFEDSLYLYGTSGNRAYIVSTKDLKTFTDHGAAVCAKDVIWKETTGIWAPDCVFRNGIYYLYYSLPTGECGVSVSNSPAGPFSDSVQVKGIEGIDPAVLMDDDGSAYIYYGQTDSVSVAKLNDDMASIDISSVRHPLNVKDFCYHEGISVRKKDGKYYLIYTDTSRHGNMPVCQGYAVSDHPTGGFSYKGVLIDNFGCDPSTWNNHGCIECFNGKWYIFYHCSTNDSQVKRQLYAEQLIINDSGGFSEAEMTSSGIYGSLSAENRIPSSVACCLKGMLIKEEDRSSEYKMILSRISEGDSAIYKYINFKRSCVFRVKTKSKTSGRVELYLDGKYHGYVFIDASSEYKEFSAEISPIRGIHTVELRFFGNPGWTHTQKMENMCFSEFSFV